MLNPQNPSHAFLEKLRLERIELQRKLERQAANDAPTEDVRIALSENRGATRAILAFLNEEVVTTMAELTEVPWNPEVHGDRRRGGS